MFGKTYSAEEIESIKITDELFKEKFFLRKGFVSLKDGNEIVFDYTLEEVN